MTMNDLTAPLGQDPRRHRRAITVPAEIIALALGLFFGAFVLWAVTAEDRSGGEPMAVAPADLRIAKKSPEVIAVPQAAAPIDSTQPATTATLPPPAPAKSPSGVTVTIVDGKTGAKREVIVATPSQAATDAERARPDLNNADTTGQLPRKR
ncbi:MAG: hypothetical protein ACLQF4_12570 [Xanthobacteraceae bacterium]